MACVPLPTPPGVPEAPPFDLEPPAVPDPPGLPDLCCKLPPVPVPLPPVPIPPLLLNPAVIATLRASIDQVLAYLNTRPLTCPLE